MEPPLSEPKVAVKPAGRRMLLRESAGLRQRTERLAGLAQGVGRPVRRSVDYLRPWAQQVVVQPAKWLRPASTASPQESASVLKLYYFQDKKDGAGSPVFLCANFSPCLRGEGYAVTYFPVSSNRLAIFSCSAMTFSGSCFARRRTIAIWVRSMSPSATAATTFFAAASSFVKAPSR